MKIYVMTDSHLGHEKLVKISDRPENFSQKVLDGILKMPRQIDLLIHLGDVCIGNDENHHLDLLMRVHGRAKKCVLVKGNHDTKSDSWYYARGSDFVCKEFYNVYFGKKILFTHAPIPKEHLSGLDFNVHGHFHGSAEDSHRYEGTMIGGGTYDKNIHKDAAPEIHGYIPVNLEKLIKKA